MSGSTFFHLSVTVTDWHQKLDYHQMVNQRSRLCQKCKKGIMAHDYRFLINKNSPDAAEISYKRF